MTKRDLPAQIKRMHRLYAVTPRSACGECQQCVSDGGHWRCELFREETRLAAGVRARLFPWPADAPVHADIGDVLAGKFQAGG